MFDLFYENSEEMIAVSYAQRHIFVMFYDYYPSCPNCKYVHPIGLKLEINEFWSFEYLNLMLFYDKKLYIFLLFCSGIKMGRIWWIGPKSTMVSLLLQLSIV